MNWEVIAVQIGIALFEKWLAEQGKTPEASIGSVLAVAKDNPKDLGDVIKALFSTPESQQKISNTIADGIWSVLKGKK